MTKLRLLLILLLLSVFSCSQKSPVESEPKRAEESKKKSYSIIVSSDGYSVLNDNFEVVGKNVFPDTVLSSVLFEDKLYLLSSVIRIVNMNTMQVSQSMAPGNKPTRNILIANRQGVIYISGTNLVFKDKTKEQFLLSGDSPITDVRENPYHSYVYCTDSMGFMYAIDLETKTLKRRFFIGRVKSFGFAKYGTRILAVTDKSFLVLDYETLNIIFEKKDFYSSALSLETSDLMFLYSGIDRKCWIYSNIDYKKKTDFTTDEKDITLHTADDSLMLLFSKERKTLTLFNREKKVFRKRIQLDGTLSFLDLRSDRALLMNDSLLFAVSLKSDSVRKINYYPKFVACHSLDSEDELKSKEEEVRQSTLKNVYSVQIYALSNVKYAQNMAEQVKTKTGTSDVFIADTTISGKVVFRVFAGKFAEREQADILREELIRKGYGRDILVKRIKVDD
ncbi:MAG: SPOR domain-containing protein [bacterium]|nr:SPOR domain-containing protein [bacterium]